MSDPATLLRDWVLRAASDQGAWFDAQLSALPSGAERDLHIFLGLAPRRLGKADLALTDADLRAAETARPGWDPRGLSVDGAARLAGLLSFQGARAFAETFKDLRRTADAAEMITLYRGLPLYPDPASLAFEAGEGLRSNIKAVFEAIAHRNPYPRDHFDQHRWNHMVLKALFVGSPLAPVVGLDARANPELAVIMRELAHERWAAGRPVTPELWRCVGPFADADGAMDDLARAFSGDALDRQGVALALAGTDHAPARALVEGSPEAAAVADGSLTWEVVADRLAAAQPAAPVLPNAEIAR